MYSTSLRKTCSAATNPSLHHLKLVYNINPHITAKTIPRISFVHHTKTIFSRINRVFLIHPVIAGSLFSGVKTELADLFAQYKIEQKPFADIDWRRNFLFFLFGTIHCGLITYFTLVKLYPVLFPSTYKYSTTVKVIFDTCITTPILYFPSFYTFKCLVFENKSFGYEKWKQYQLRYWTQNIKADATNSAKFWGPVHFVTFTLIPHHLKLVWIGGVSVVWTVILSMLRGSNTS